MARRIRQPAVSDSARELQPAGRGSSRRQTSRCVFLSTTTGAHRTGRERSVVAATTVVDEQPVPRDPTMNLFAAPRFIDRVEDCFFYHAMELPGFGLIPAHWDLRGRFDDYIGGIDVRGKSVLDVGTATGFLSFEAEKRGASRVLSFDMGDARQQMFIPFKDKPYYQDHEQFVADHA